MNFNFIALFLCLCVVPGIISQAPPPLSVHVLDTVSVDNPNAVNMTCVLYKLIDQEFVQLKSGLTDIHGRLNLLPYEQYLVGTYRITFNLKDYYNRRNITTIFPRVELTLDVTDPRVDYHIPLLVSPFGITTYRGS